MKLTLLATFGILAATTTAVTARTNVWKRTTTNVKLCNDFHYGNRCGTFPIQINSHACSTRHHTSSSQPSPPPAQAPNAPC